MSSTNLNLIVYIILASFDNLGVSLNQLFLLILDIFLLSRSSDSTIYAVFYNQN